MSRGVRGWPVREVGREAHHPRTERDEHRQAAATTSESISLSHGGDVAGAQPRCDGVGRPPGAPSHSLPGEPPPRRASEQARTREDDAALQARGLGGHDSPH